MPKSLHCPKRMPAFYSASPPQLPPSSLRATVHCKSPDTLLAGKISFILATRCFSRFNFLECARWEISARASRARGAQVRSHPPMTDPKLGHPKTQAKLNSAASGKICHVLKILKLARFFFAQWNFSKWRRWETDLRNFLRLRGLKKKIALSILASSFTAR